MKSALQSFPPTHTAALERLQSFIQRAGTTYARLRNFDRDGHPHVSGLSPYLRHRILSETDVLAATRPRKSGALDDKFVQEVVWRTYWKGWLELRPSIWSTYRAGLNSALNRVQTETGLRQQWEAACTGGTGIDAFDHWARELCNTGYLHNHARMWFASIWIFTLRLPWELGADFFLRHLLDGDPASNTLSWRWVAGLHTQGKTYLASRDNIAKYTDGRFAPEDLATRAEPLPFRPHPAPRALPSPVVPAADARTLLLVTEEDLSPGWLLRSIPKPAVFATLSTAAHRSPLAVSETVIEWTDSAIQDCLDRHNWPDAARLLSGEDLRNLIKTENIEQVITSHLPTGPAHDHLTSEALGVPLIQMMRPYDRRFWPNATHGFFRFRAVIPEITASLPPL